MQAKIEAARRAVDWGVPAVVVTSGRKQHAIQQVVNGEPFGTLFVSDPEAIIIRAE